MLSQRFLHRYLELQTVFIYLVDTLKRDCQSLNSA